MHKAAPSLEVMQSDNPCINGAGATQPTELVPLMVKGRRRLEYRFAPVCHGCGQPILNINEANVAVVGGGSRDKLIGKHNGKSVYRIDGRAFVFCWPCDRAQEENNVPWEYAAATFRSRDERPARRGGK